MATAAAPPDNAGEQVPPSPGRHSLSGPEFRELAYKAKRFAQALGTRTRRMMVEDAREGGGAGGGRWAGAATGVGLGSNEVLGRALSRFREGVERLPGGERMRGVGAVVGGTRTNTFEALRPAMEDHLRRVAIPKNYRFKSSGTHYSATNTSSWEYAKANISRVEKLGAWLHSSRHPSKKKLESVLWTGLEVVLDCLTRQDVGGGLPFAFLDIFCTSLRELATVLPSSLNYIQTRGILEDVEVQALMGFIYAYILELVVAPARCIAPFFQGYVGTAGGCSTGGGYSGGGAGGTSGIIRGTLRQHITHGAQHLSPRLPAAAGTSSFRGAPRSPASRPPMSSSGAGATEADSSTTPGPPQISSANRAPISRDYPSTTHWENQVRSILEKVIYHSRLVQSELVQLEASQQRERFDVIARLFEEAEEARKKEGEERRKLQELEEKGKVEVKERSSLAPDQSSKDATTQGGNPPAVTSASALPSSLDISQQLPPSATRPSPLPRIITEIDLTTQLTAYNSAKAHREGVLRRLLTEAGKIRCDVCCFTAYDVSGNVGTPGAGATLASSITEEDSSVKFSSNINELAKILIGGAERSGGHDQGKGDKDGNGDYTSVGKEKPTLFKLL